MAGLIEEARLRGTAVTLAAAGRSAGGTPPLTEDERVGTSICDSAARTSSRPSTILRSDENAAAIRQMLEGMCVNTMVLTRPMRRDSQAATGNEKAPSRLVQKKNRLAASSERSKR